MEKFNNKLLLKFFLGVITLFLFFIFSPNVLAVTEVEEDITVDTVWNQTNSPYIIRSSIAIVPGARLEVESGTVVKFDYGASLYVLGNLSAGVSGGDKIYFTSLNDDTVGGNTNEDLWCYEDVNDEGNILGEVCEDQGSEPEVGDWQGVYFYQGEDQSVLKNIVFKYADQALELYASGAYFENLEIYNSENGMNVLEGSSVTVKNGAVNGLSSNVFQVFNSSSASLSGVDIRNISYGDAVAVFNGSSLAANNLNIENVSGYSAQDILIFNNSKLILDHAVLKGCPGSACVTFFDGYGYGEKPTVVNIENSKFEGGSSAGFLTFGEGHTSATIKNSVIRDFAGYAVESYATYTIDAKNNFWGNEAGPYHPTLNPSGTAGRVTDGALFEPWCKTETCKTHNPVILIPGITGTYLLKGDGSNDEVWPNLAKLLLPGKDSFLNYLSLEPDGMEDPGRPIVLGDIIRGAIGVHVFDSLINEFINNGYVEGTDLFVFPYDWRKSSAENAGLLRNKIDAIMSDAGTEKIDIIAHSMGGILAKKYIVDNFGEKVDHMIFIGTPHLGAPKTFKALMYGDDMGYSKFLLKMNPNRTKEISQNMSAVYELLPSQKYVSINGSYVVNATDQLNVKGLDYTDTTNLMISSGRNPFMFPFAENLHNEVDNLDLSGTKTYNFIGCGTKTIGKIILKKKLSWTSLWLKKTDDFDLELVNGDETVPLVSADQVDTVNRYYVKGTTHGSLPSADGLREDVVAILNNQDLPVAENVLSNTDNCKVSGKLVSSHSPVELHIYDTEGNHTGPNADGDIEEGIPGVQYYVLEGEKFAFLPDGVNYKIITSATDIGGYNFQIKNEDQNDVVTDTYDWRLIPLKTLRARGEVWVGPDYPETDYAVKMDEDGNGSIDKTYPISYDGTAFAEESTNPIIAVTNHGGGGFLARNSGISAMIKIPKIVQKETLPEEKDMVPKVVEKNNTQSLTQNETVGGSPAKVDLIASAGNSSVKVNKTWILIFGGVFILGILAKRFIKV